MRKNVVVMSVLVLIAAASAQAKSNVTDADSELTSAMHTRLEHLFQAFKLDNKSRDDITKNAVDCHRQAVRMLKQEGEVSDNPSYKNMTVIKIIVGAFVPGCTMRKMFIDDYRKLPRGPDKQTQELIGQYALCIRDEYTRISSYAATLLLGKHLNKGTCDLAKIIADTSHSTPPQQ